MKISILNRIVVVALISAAWLVGMSIPANAQGQQQQEHQLRQNKKQQKKQRPQKAQKPRQQQQRGQNIQQQQRAQQQRNQNQQQAHLPQQRQQQLIEQQQQRVRQYSQNLDQRQRAGQQREAQLQKQGRMAQYRFQQQYSERERQQEMSLRNDHHNYNSDPFFYTASDYRYRRGGRYYETNQYGANVLREAVNNGYREGFLAGQADRQDRWRFNYQGSYAYQDANYGYGGYYVS